MSSTHPAQELADLLQSLSSLKPPGVNKAKVDAASKICTDPQNVSVELALVDTFVNSFRRSQPQYKLGILYVIDAIARAWVTGGAMHAGGLRKMTDNLPILLSEVLPVIPDNQKEKLSKLLSIWISSKTFPVPLLQDYQQKLQNPAQARQQSFVPPPQPPVQTVADAPANLLAAFGAPPQAQPQAQPPAQQPLPQAQAGAANPDTNALFAALAGLAPRPPVPQPATQPAAPLYAQANPPAQYPPVMQQGFGQQSSNVAPPPPFNVPFNMAGLAQPAAAPAAPSNPLGQLSELLGPLLNPQGGPPDPTTLASQIQILQTLAQQLPPDALMALLAASGFPAGPRPAQPAPVAPPVAQVQQQPQYAQNGNYGAPSNGQSYGGRDEHKHNGRARSRSPDYKRRRHSPLNRRESPTYGTYDPTTTMNAGGPNAQDERGRGKKGRIEYDRNQFRQRTPPSMRDLSEFTFPPNMQPKPIGYDLKLPQGRIKVLSRTLFVGGVKTTEEDLKSFFRQFGGVQTCIVNHDKRHAFLKLVSHQDAIATKTSIDHLPDSEYRPMFERVGWAVGFGPTQYADYQIGVSVIPIDLLTDADRKWLLTAEYGGTGGKQIATGMVVEEPDIEIGAGPSSKAIHRRGGGHGTQGRGGNNFGRRGGHEGGQQNHQQQRYRKPEAPTMPEAHTGGPPPPVPTFGAPIPGFPMNMNFR